MALETCYEGCSRDTLGFRVLGWPLRAQALGIFGLRTQGSHLFFDSSLRLCSTAIARAGSCLSSPFLNQMAGNLFFPPHQSKFYLCVSQCPQEGVQGAKWINAYPRQIISLRRREGSCIVRVGAEPREKD